MMCFPLNDTGNIITALKEGEGNITALVIYLTIDLHVSTIAHRWQIYILLNKSFLQHAHLPNTNKLGTVRSHVLLYHLALVPSCGLYNFLGNSKKCDFPPWQRDSSVCYLKVISALTECHIQISLYVKLSKVLQNGLWWLSLCLLEYWLFISLSASQVCVT